MQKELDGMSWTREFPLVNVVGIKHLMEFPLGGKYCDRDQWSYEERFCGKGEIGGRTGKVPEMMWTLCAQNCSGRLRALYSVTWGPHSF